MSESGDLQSEKEKRKSEEQPPAVEKKRKVTMRDTSGIETVSMAFVEEVITEWKKSRLGNAEKKQEEEILLKLNQIAKKWITKGTATLYGSRLIGTASFNSDVDVSFSWPGYRPVSTSEMEEVMNKKITKLCKTLGAKSFHHAYRIPGKTAVVTCIASDTGVTVDVTFNNNHAVEASKVLGVVAEYFPEFPASMWLLKKLGKARNFTNPKHKKLSSYCLSVMMCWVMQLLKLLPHFTSPITEDSIRQQCISYKLQQRNSNELNSMMLSKMIAKFFTTFHTKPDAVVSLSERVPDKAETSTHKSPIYVFDPLDSTNCGRMLNEIGWLHALFEFGRAVDLIRNDDNLTTWLDSSDPN